MKINQLCLGLISLLLAGCADSAGSYVTSSRAQYDEMRAAIKASAPEIDRCAKNRETSAIPRKEFLKYVVCKHKVYQARVMPVSKYPDLVQKLMATVLEDAALYGQGKIEYEQLASRSELANLKLNEETQKRDWATFTQLSAKDQAENDEMARAMSSFKQPPTVRTTCFSTGMATNCTSR